MNNRNKIIAMLVFLVAVAIGGYFLTSKKNISINTSETKSISDIQSGQTANENTDRQAAENESQESAEQTKPMNTSSEKSDGASTTVKAPAKVTEEKVEEPANQETQDSIKIVKKFVSWGFQKSSGRTIKAVIVHTSYNAIGGDVFDFDKVVQEWKDAGVAPHYAITREGTIYQLVADQNIAWHAGNSKLPDGTTDVNGVSIGIEMINDQDSKFTDAQYKSLNSLIKDLKNKYPIKYILGHDEIAPGRKTDPWGIDWKRVDR